MSLVFSLALASSPLFSWADSLYLDVPRLGMVEEYESSGRTSNWIYADIAVLERNSRGRWIFGLHPVSAAQQLRIDDILAESIDTLQHSDLKPIKSYCMNGIMYEAQSHTGPWAEIERLLAELEPSYTVDVRNSVQGTGSRAVSGTIVWGEEPAFVSVDGDLELICPPASVGVEDYIATAAEERELEIDQMTLPGVLYLQDDFPLFFYVRER